MLVSLMAAAVGFFILIDERSVLRYGSQFILGGREKDVAAYSDPGALTAVERLSRIQESAGGTPVVGGNRVTLLNDGPETYDAMLEAIDAAQNHINLETYIFKDDAAGQIFATKLKQKAADGIAVSLIYDKYGSLDTSADFFDDLKQAGVRVAGFQDIVDIRVWRVNQRHHRKTVIVDGRIAFTGGINISDEYLASSEQRLEEEEALKRGWRDDHVRIEGPLVTDLQRLFLETWLNSGERTDPAVEYFPATEPAGGDLATIVAADRTDTESRIIDSYIAAIRNARDRVYITQAYFVPHFEFIQSLIDAAQRGVDVKVILPSFTDIDAVLYASRAHYAPLLKADVELYELEGSVLHSKTAVIDGLWSTVGSSNLDIRSLEHNNEANVIVIGPQFGEEMERVFADDLKDSRRVALDEWQSRGLWAVTKERASLLFKYWL